MAIDVWTEGLTTEEAKHLKECTARMQELAKDAADGKKGNVSDWFGSAKDQALPRLACMNRYVNGRCKKITYVKKIVGAVCDSALVEIDDLGQVIPSVGAPRWNSNVQVNWSTHELNTPTGIRIFILPGFFDCTKNRNLHSLYHEVTHKVINTVDVLYGREKCKNLATSSPASALWCAASYGYYAASMDKNPPDP